MILHLLGPECSAANAAEAADAIAAERAGGARVPRPAARADEAPGRESKENPPARFAADHRVVTLGPVAGEAARRAGLAVDASVCPPGGVGRGGRIPLAARASLRRAFARPGGRLGEARPQEGDLIVAWDVSALAIAAAFARAPARVLRLSDPLAPGQAAWLHSRLLWSGFDIATASEALRRDLLAAGLPAGRVRRHASTLDPDRLAPDRLGSPGLGSGSGSSPGSTSSAADRGPETPENATVRGAADDRLEFLVASGPRVDARALVLAAALAQEAGGRRIALRMSPSAARLAEALDIADATETSAGGGPAVVQDARMDTPWRAMAPGAGAVFLLPSGGGTHAARWAGLAGLRRVFMDTPAALGLDPDEANRPGDVVSRHPLPRDLAAAMVAAGAAGLTPTPAAAAATSAA